MSSLVQNVSDMPKRFVSLFLLISVSLALSGCDMPEWLGEGEDPPLPGERISILLLEDKLKADPTIADLDVRLPRPYVNDDWPQSSGHPTHAMHHLALGDALELIWRVDIGAGSDDLERLMAAPIYANDMIYVLDANSHVSARRADNGELIWRYNLTPKGEEKGAIGGGLAYGDGTLFVTTGYGEVRALEPENGAEIWVAKIGIPIRGAPTFDRGKVFAISYDNRLHALNAIDGSVQWSHVGISENAGLIGAASAASQGAMLVVPYSSGELFALRAANGQVAWADSLTRVGRLTSLSQLGDINGAPVIDRGRVFAVSHAGRMVAIDLRTGRRIWDQDIGSIQTPWVAGNFVFVVTSDAQVVAMSRDNGRVRWVRQLARYGDPEDRVDPIQWAGPLLAGDRIIVASSEGAVIAISPYTGEVIGQIAVPDGVSISPIVANGTLYLLTDNAELLAYR